MSKKRKKESFMLGRILQKIAPRIGATVMLEPEWKIAGQITFRSGKRCYFRYNTLDLNHMGSSEIAKDKDYANYFMDALGYPIVPGSKTFFSDTWTKTIGVRGRKINDAYRYAQRLGFPVVVKPNSGSQGSGVTLVHNRVEFYRAMKAIFRVDRVALVQTPVQGKDYRLVVLDNKVLSAYERIPLSVVGNGKSNILQLLKAKQHRFKLEGRDTQIRTNDPRMATKLKHQGLSMRSVPAKEQQVFLLDNANLSTGGDSVDVTNLVHPSFKRLAVNLTQDMGLRLCGVDLMVQGDISQKPETFWILEINSAPGLDHYAKSGPTQEQIVEHLYLQVLKRME